MSRIIDGDKLLRKLDHEYLIYPYDVVAEERAKEKLRSIIYSLPEEKSLQGRCELHGMYPTGSWFCGNARKKEE